MHKVGVPCIFSKSAHIWMSNLQWFKTLCIKRVLIKVQATVQQACRDSCFELYNHVGYTWSGFHCHCYNVQSAEHCAAFNVGCRCAKRLGDSFIIVHYYDLWDNFENNYQTVSSLCNSVPSLELDTCPINTVVVRSTWPLRLQAGQFRG